MRNFLLAFVSVFTLQLHAIQSNPNSDFPYEVIGADTAATEEALNLAWRTALKTHHPDRGGSAQDVRNVIEAGQFLKAHRTLYDRGLLPYKGVYKPEETRPVPIEYEEILKYQLAYLGYMRVERKARELAGSDPDDHPVFLLYAMLNLRGDHEHYPSFQPAQLRAYRDLLYHVDLLRLTKFEVAGIALNDPVEALSRLLEHYDNFTVSRRTLNDLFNAYNEFYISNEERSESLIDLIDSMERSHRLYEPRYAVIRTAAVASLKRWVVEYFYELPRTERRERREIYLKARRLILNLEPFFNYVRDCGQLMLGRRLKP